MTQPSGIGQNAQAPVSNLRSGLDKLIASQQAAKDLAQKLAQERKS